MIMIKRQIVHEYKNLILLFGIVDDLFAAPDMPRVRMSGKPTVPYRDLVSAHHHHQRTLLFARLNAYKLFCHNA
jgi:hypothetical protein